MKRLLLLGIMMTTLMVNAKTLVVYYSYTNNVKSVVNVLSTLIDTDVVEIQPAEKGLDYAANNYAIGSALIAAIRNNPDDEASYPAIDSVEVNLEDYDTIIIGAPLWGPNGSSIAVVSFQKRQEDGRLKHRSDSFEPQ